MKSVQSKDKSAKRNQKSEFTKREELSIETGMLQLNDKRIKT